MPEERRYPAEDRRLWRQGRGTEVDGLESYYTKTQVDETFVKKTDIVMATDEEVDAMLTEVFGAQATV